MPADEEFDGSESVMKLPTMYVAHTCRDAAARVFILRVSTRSMRFSVYIMFRSIENRSAGDMCVARGSDKRAIISSQCSVTTVLKPDKIVFSNFGYDWHRTYYFISIIHNVVLIGIVLSVNTFPCSSCRKNAQGDLDTRFSGKLYLVDTLFDAFFNMPSSFLERNKKRRGKPGEIADVFVLDTDDFRVIQTSTYIIFSRSLIIINTTSVAHSYLSNTKVYHCFPHNN